jgi:RHH-type proline utilization regulon transcriptional repressor/proline dehydrogenase/delta 1-pyrroline-5-carboxylate dehydrogenase
MRDTIEAAYRRGEQECVADLIAVARLPYDVVKPVAALARGLVEQLRARRGRAVGVDALMAEFSLSSQEGVALMCLAEALLRIPDTANRDRLIRDKIGGADWGAHVGGGRSLFVNAASWGLLVTGKLVSTASETGFLSALTGVVARGGEPLIRAAVDLAMRMLGQQFVTGETIGAALIHAAPFEKRGFRYSFDMLGEAASTAEDAAAYLESYETAIRAIGEANSGRGVYLASGISVKLSAVHPRYGYTQSDRMRDELLPRLRGLALLAQEYDIGLNIDAEEADRLEPSLDLLEALADDPALAGWQGLGFVVQAYQKRAVAVIDHVIDLARRSGHRLMIRLVKGAYWDSEIKRAQVDGMDDYPVFTRKAHTDVSYLACAKRLLAARDVVFPQFATHNAQTVAAIYHLAGPAFAVGDWEFQCLHGMGEPLYEQVVGVGGLDRPCRIYAPVGSHETLLAYLVRRLLENGANSSFVHRLVDRSVPVEALIEDPVVAAEASGGAPHPGVLLPRNMFAPERLNSCSIDLSARRGREAMQAALDALPRVGGAADAGDEAIEAAFSAAGRSGWAVTLPAQRAAALEMTAVYFERDMAALAALLVREAGKTLAAAIGEVREAVDYCRYYAARIREFDNATHVPLGTVVCISPWNFPLAIFSGQVAAALAAGNSVLAKPAEQTPAIAVEAVRRMHEAGIAREALHLLPGRGETVGARLVTDPRCQGVMFTGSTDVAKSLQRSVAERGDIPLIAETGGQNAMIVDSSALPEQVVADVIASAFDSAGQRCSALRLLCVQEEIAERVITMLKGAMAELRVGTPENLSTDVGPVIDGEAWAALNVHLDRFRTKIVQQAAVPDRLPDGFFVTPALIEIADVGELSGEVFGPILHVVRFKRLELGELVDAINRTGYGLTCGIHSRIDETIDFVATRMRVGNLYVNRNMIGAVVGVQPFGGEGLSGTGPKAGGPLYLHRLLRRSPAVALRGVLSLPGPVGEENTLGFVPRGRVLGVANDIPGATAQLAAAAATGNRFVLRDRTKARQLMDAVPQALAELVDCDDDQVDAVLVEGTPPSQPFSARGAGEARMMREVARWPGPIIPVCFGGPEYDLTRLVWERTRSTNTAAAGGNAQLMTLET